MRVVQINTTCGIGSTGKICAGISEMMKSHNIENYILYSSKTSGCESGIKCSNKNYIKVQALKSKILGNYGFNSYKATKKIISALDDIHPDIVHLHNIHGHDCDLEMLFAYFKQNKIKLIWTFHDCWAFTGYCPHFTMMKCDKWKTECLKCVQSSEYSWFFDRSSELFNRKKKLFDGLDLTIVTPSFWLSELVKQSFLKDYPVQVINNGIDLDVFKPTYSDFRQRYNLENKKIILGVSFGWDKRKGLDVFMELFKRLSSDFRILLIGTDEKIDSQLPNGIITIHRTQNQRELVKVYSSADVFVNPTREEVFGLVNVEALACGTPGVTFNSGGSPECYDETCGSVVQCDDIDSLEKEIIRICTDKPFLKENCVKKAEKFNKDDRFKEYLELYERVIATGT